MASLFQNLKAWIKDNFLQKERDRECLPLKEVQKYKAEDEILEAIEKDREKLQKDEKLIKVLSRIEARLLR